MGGDHKCPVCQATFTRPQHVARHMRSHTGDRPYKCQHCGDQFARSDLLSRHVNKCHAGEKSIGGTGNTRRKGGASATRATTSKQACDQCVQGSLPCDGCNPCAKCVQRKCRCTYVKFHRQTAPIGPGHNPRPSTASSTSSLSSLSSVSSTSAGLTGAAMIPPGVYGHYPPPTGHYPNASYAPGPNIVGYGDETASSNLNPLLLGPAPGSTIPNISSQHPTDPSSSSATGYSGSFTFPPVFPPRDDRGYESDYDYTTKYRAQAAELMRRGSMPSTASSQPEWWSDGGGVGNYYGVYYRPGSSHGHGDESDSGTSSATSSSVHLPLVGAEDHHQQYLLNGHGHHHARHDSSASPPSGILHPHTHVSPQHISPPHAHAQAHAIPPHSASTDGSRPNTSNGFSNAFGLMSLDDPNVLAGLASDGQPFFSAFETLEQLQNHQQQQRNREEDPNVTPMPRFTNGSPHQGATALPSVAVTGSGTGQSTGQRPSTSGGYPPAAHHQPQQFPVTPREQETRELREFWKAYMRTPLTGGGPLGGPAPAPTSSTNSNSVSPPNVNGNGDIHMLSPGPSVIGGYRRQRVSSLPSVKTPTEEGAYYYGPSSTWAPNGTNGTGGIGPKSNSNPNTGTNPLAPLHGHGYHSMHSIIQQPSSNQAALGNMRTPHPQQQQQQVSMTGADDLKSYEAAVLARKAPTNLNLVPKMRRGNKPPSGQQQQATNGTTNNRVSFAPGTASETTTTGMRATSPSKRRPSFKRLPSQTLESGVEKRQRWKGSFDDQDDGEDEGADGDESSGDEGGSAESSGGSVGLPAASSGGVRLVALDANTGSAPSVSPPAVGGGATMMAAGAA